MIKFSIVISTCNREVYLLDALSSALVARPELSEIIVVNDGEVFSHKLVIFFNENDIKHISTEGYQGPSVSRNTGVQAALGEWILFLDDDDVVMPTYWHCLSRHLNDEANVSDIYWGFSSIKMFKDRRSISKIQGEVFDFVFNNFNFKDLRDRLGGLGAGFWISRDLYLKVGGLKVDLLVNEDTDFCLRLAAKPSVCLQTDGVGVFVFNGNHAQGSRLSITRSSNAENRARCFRIIIEENIQIIRTCIKTEYWIWMRCLKFSAKIFDRDIIKLFWKISGLNLFLKLKLSGFYISCYMGALFAKMLQFKKFE